MSVFFVTSKDLPTVAMFVQISRAYAFKRTLVKQGIKAEVIQTESLVDEAFRESGEEEAVEITME